MSETKLADRTLEAVTEFSSARRAALFVREQERVLLVAGHNVDGEVLEWVSASWAAQRSSLLHGEARFSSAKTLTRALVPVADEGQLIGLLYVETEPGHLVEERDRLALAQLARIAALALAAPLTLPVAQAGIELFLERSSPEDIARRQLLVILDRHEWNIAQVARLLGVTRATVYNRLQRLGIERRRITKGSLAAKRQPA